MRSVERGRGGMRGEGSKWTLSWLRAFPERHSIRPVDPFPCALPISLPGRLRFRDDVGEQAEQPRYPAVHARGRNFPGTSTLGKSEIGRK